MSYDRVSRRASTVSDTADRPDRPIPTGLTDHTSIDRATMNSIESIIRSILSGNITYYKDTKDHTINVNTIDVKVMLECTDDEPLIRSIIDSGTIHYTIDYGIRLAIPMTITIKELLGTGTITQHYNTIRELAIRLRPGQEVHPDAVMTETDNFRT